MTAINTVLRRRALTIRPGVALALLAALAMIWLVSFEGGFASQALASSGSFLHEMFHDGRHLLGVPCH